MTFQKAEMQSELKDFLFHFVGSIERVYGGNPGGGLLGFPDKRVHDISMAEAKVENTMLWRTVNDMYDFGISGIMVEGRHLGCGELLDSDFCDTEMFLRGLTSLEQYLDEDATNIPRLSILAVRTAVARHVLEGGDRYTGFGEEYGALISISEMALLADMDERSVRNAANPKLPNPLVTVVQGKRTYVDPGEAKRWLAERKGFVPTKMSSEAAPQVDPSEPASIQLSASTIAKLNAKATATGVSVDSLITQLLAQ